MPAALSVRHRAGTLLYVGGSGQVAAPGQPLPQPLQVGVASGLWPVQGATVRFVVVSGGGVLQSGGASADVVTGSNGIASCSWRLGAVTQGQQVQATLLDAAGQPVHLPVRFIAPFNEDADDLGVQILKMVVGNGAVLENDVDLAVDALATGIDLICSAKLADGTGTRATCFLTMELPFPATASDTDFWGKSVIGFQPRLGIWTYRAPRTLTAFSRIVTIAATSLADRNRVARATVTLIGPLGPIDVDFPGPLGRIQPAAPAEPPAPEQPAPSPPPAPTRKRPGKPNDPSGSSVRPRVTSAQSWHLLRHDVRRPFYDPLRKVHPSDKSL